MGKPYLCAQLLLCVLLAPCFVQSASGESDEEILDFLAQGYLANRESFHDFTCRFRVLEGQSPSADAALAGELQNQVSKKGLWLVNGSDVRYDLLCDEALELQPPARGIQTEGSKGVVATSLPCLGMATLYDGDSNISLTFGALLNVANLQSEASLAIVVTPISMGVMGRDESYSPANDVQNSRNGTTKCRYLGRQKLVDREVDVIEAGYVSADSQVKRQWFLDSRRGFIPVQVVFFSDGNVIGTTKVTAIRPFPNGAYIPERSVTTWNRPSGVQAMIVELLELDFAPPRRELLALSLPAGAKVVDLKDMRSLVRLSKSEVVQVDRLTDWVARCDAALKLRLDEYEKRSALQVTGNGKAAGKWIWAILIVGIVVPFILVFFWRRQRSPV